MMFCLKDGTPVGFHMLQPEDAPCILMHFRKLSDRSRYFRFMSSVKQLPKETLESLMDVDPATQVAICLHTVCDGQSRGVGIARYVRDREDPTQAETAIVVMDEFQNRGAGTLLFEKLIQQAKQNGIQKLTGVAFPDNLRLQKLLQKFQASIRFDGQLINLLIDVQTHVESKHHPLPIRAVNQ